MVILFADGDCQIISEGPCFRTLLGDHSVDWSEERRRVWSGVSVGGDDRVLAGGSLVCAPDYADPRGWRRCRGRDGGQQGARDRASRGVVLGRMRRADRQRCCCRESPVSSASGSSAVFSRS